MGYFGSNHSQSVGETATTCHAEPIRVKQKVSIDPAVHVHYGDGEAATFDCTFTHATLKAWKSKPWKLDLGLVDHPASRTTYRLIDDADPPSRLRPESGDGTELIDGVRNERPDLLGRPGWIQEGWHLFEQRARVWRRGEGPTAYVRTWFLHHDRTRRWHNWREFRLDEWPQDWPRRIHELWRDQLGRESAFNVGWVNPPIDPIAGWENHLGDLIVFQQGVEPRSSILCLSIIDSHYERRLQLHALSVPRRHELLRMNNLMITTWRQPYRIRRGGRVLMDGLIDHVDLAGITIQVDALEEDQFSLLQLQPTFSPTTQPVTLSGPLSEMAVLNTKVNHFQNLKSTLTDHDLKTDHADENFPPLQYEVKGLSEARQARVLIAGVHPETAEEDRPEEPNDEDDDPTDDEPDYTPPENTPPEGTSFPDQLQSAALYEVGQRERHAQLRWNSHPSLLRSVADFLSLHDLHDLHDLQFRSVGLPEGVYPTIVHKFEDIATGSLDQLAVLDVVVHDRITPSVTDRRTLTLPGSVRRTDILIKARIDAYCQEMNDRCIVLMNGNNWPSQDLTSRSVSHGAYFQIHIPPWTLNNTNTAQAIWRTQTGRSIPDLEDAFPAHHRKSPSTSSERDISPTEPYDRNEEQYDPEDSASNASQQGPAQDEAPNQIHDDLLDTPEAFLDDLLRTWGDSSAVELEELGPVAYFAVWYVSSDRMHRCDRSRHVGLLADHQSWLRRIAELWNDIIDPKFPLMFSLVHPEPPTSVTSGGVAGHIILSQHLRPHECATHMTVTRADLREMPHIVWAMVARRHTNKAAIFGWHLVTAVCPPMAPRNRCTCWSGAHEIRDRDDVNLHNGQGIHTLVERTARAADPGSARFRNLVATASERREGDIEPAEEETPGDYFGIVEFAPTLPDSDEHRRHTLQLTALIPEVPQTTIVRLIQSHWIAGFPPYIEVPIEYDESSIAQELSAWGHNCQTQILRPHDVAFCLPVLHEPGHDVYILYANDDVLDGEGAFAHASDHQWSDLEHMKFLHSLGYFRAAITSSVLISPHLQFVRFQDVSAKMFQELKTPRQPTPWPAVQPLQTNWSRVSRKFDALATAHERYELGLARSIEDIKSLLTSSLDSRFTDTAHLELPEIARTAIDSIPVASSEQQFDRLVIYTDGSSKAQMRRTVPDRPDDPKSGVDTWTFLVLGETYACGDQVHHMADTASSVLW